jgi:mRNA interferase MazF
VVISNRAYNVARPDVVIMAVTSQVRPTIGAGEVQIGDWKRAKLLKPSVIKPVFATLEQKLFVRHLGTLQPRDLMALRAAILAVIG